MPFPKITQLFRRQHEPSPYYVVAAESQVVAIGPYPHEYATRIAAHMNSRHTLCTDPRYVCVNEDFLSSLSGVTPRAVRAG